MINENTIVLNKSSCWTRMNRQINAINFSTASNRILTSPYQVLARRTIYTKCRVNLKFHVIRYHMPRSFNLSFSMNCLSRKRLVRAGETIKNSSDGHWRLLATHSKWLGDAIWVATQRLRTGALQRGNVLITIFWYTVELLCTSSLHSMDGATNRGRNIFCRA